MSTHEGSWICSLFVGWVVRKEKREEKKRKGEEEKRKSARACFFFLRLSASVGRTLRFLARAFSFADQTRSFPVSSRGERKQRTTGASRSRAGGAMRADKKQCLSLRSAAVDKDFCRAVVSSSPRRVALFWRMEISPLQNSRASGNSSGEKVGEARESLTPQPFLLHERSRSSLSSLSRPRERESNARQERGPSTLLRQLSASHPDAETASPWRFRRGNSGEEEQRSQERALFAPPTIGDGRRCRRRRRRSPP